jgi:hypothetical protein
MATGSFYYPDPQTVTAQTNGPFNLACEVTVSAPGGNLVGVRFWKIAADTGTHTATVYRTSDQALLGSQAFTGESASGWQSMTFSAPVALAAGTYRVCVNHTTVNYCSVPNTGMARASAPYAVAAGAFGLAGAGTGYPVTAYGSFNFLVDPVVDGLAESQGRTTQVLAEVWTPGPAPRTVVTQAVLEAWINRLPVTSTAEIVSQALVEAWATNMRHPATQLVVSQALTEVWMLVGVPGRVFRLSSQVV